MNSAGCKYSFSLGLRQWFSKRISRNRRVPQNIVRATARNSGTNKVKFALEQIMEAQRVSRSMALLFL
jgi:hypothetical protein